MKPLFFLLPLVTLLSFRLQAQTNSRNDGYHLSTPTFGLAGIQSAIQKMGDFHYGQAKALSQPQYDSLTLDEKFTYNMIHPEWFSQMCSTLPFADSAAARIYSQMPRFFGEYAWSNRQYDFFKNNHDSVERLIKEVITKDGGAGSNLLAVIVMINAKDLIPLLIETYRHYQANHYILTTLLRLMDDNKYPEFISSAQHKQLYSHQGVYSSTYAAYLPYTTANIDFILQQAANFYHDTVRH